MFFIYLFCAHILFWKNYHDVTVCCGSWWTATISFSLEVSL